MSRAGVAIIVLLLFGMASNGQAADHTTVMAAEQALQRLQTLVGTWKREGAGASDFRIRFETTAGGTVLVETWLAGARPHSLTLYHADGERLMATHYCPQGNQPRLLLASASTLENMTFRFHDATNLADPEQSHQHALGFDFSEAPVRLRRSETYRSGDGDESSELLLVRADAKAAE